MTLQPRNSRSRLSTLLVVFALLIVAGGVVALMGVVAKNSDVTSGLTASTTTVSMPTASSSSVPPTTNPPPSPTTTLSPHEAALASLISEMPLINKALQLLVVGGQGTGFLTTIQERIGSGCVGGVFLAESQGNWGRTATGSASSNAVLAPSLDCEVSPLVATDAEAGTQVLKVPIPPLAHPRSLDVAVSEDLVGAVTEFRERSTRFATDLANAGVHLNFGVVADVDVDANHHMARQRRSFGGDPIAVQALVEAMVTGHCKAGVAAVLKHFPNQGATLIDPHLGDSVSSNTFEQWQSFGAVPYRDTKAPVVMVGHIRYPGVDQNRPASLSPEIIGGWLRREFGFSGVVVTDDLAAMRGVGEAGTPGDRAVAAIKAGVDLVLFVDHDEISEIVAAIVERGETDPNFLRRINESLDRVLRLKASLGLVVPLNPEQFSQHRC